MHINVVFYCTTFTFFWQNKIFGRKKKIFFFFLPKLFFCHQKVTQFCSKKNLICQKKGERFLRKNFFSKISWEKIFFLESFFPKNYWKNFFFFSENVSSNFKKRPGALIRFFGVYAKRLLRHSPRQRGRLQYLHLFRITFRFTLLYFFSLYWQLFLNVTYFDFFTKL